MNDYFEPESNAPREPIKITPRKTQIISIADYYNGAPLKEWNLQDIILARVKYEDQVIC